jgi:hypothetical protein
VYDLQDESGSDHDHSLRNKGTTPKEKDLLEDDDDLVLSSPAKSPNKDAINSLKTG